MKPKPANRRAFLGRALSLVGGVWAFVAGSRAAAAPPRSARVESGPGARPRPRPAPFTRRRVGQG